MAFAEKLKILREENNMTQKAVANRLKIARSTVAGYETKTRQPSYDKLAAISSLFHVTIDYLLDDETIAVDNSMSALHSDEEKKLIAKYRNLSADSKKDLTDYIHLLELRDEKHSDD